MKHYRSKEKTNSRLFLLRLGREALKAEEVWNSDHHIIYHRWTEELKEEHATAEIKDQQLADIVVDLSMFYRDVNNAAPR